MDVQIQEVESEVEMMDAQAMLTPELLSRVVEAVMQALRDEQHRDSLRRHDMRIDERASRLD